jgi:GTP pyrophosphokinase
VAKIEKDLDILKTKLLNGNYCEADIERIMRAAGFGKIWHADQKRASGEPYFIHPIQVASILIDLNLDCETIIAALLHDTVEDTEITLEFISQQFGPTVASLVDGVTKIDIIKAQSKSIQTVETIRKIIISMANDIRVIFIKLADRLHNMRTLKFLKPEKQILMSRETMDIYAPIASQLGISEIRGELEDLSLKYLNPEVYEKIRHYVVYRRSKIKRYLERQQELIKEAAFKEGIEIKTEARVKHIYSIYKKMLKYDVEPSGLFDIFGIRVYCQSVNECYAMLSVIHGMWKPIENRIKDYISVPKPNGYQSLHTAVYAEEGRIVEVQIRTYAMHIAAEYGIAAHWLYKSGKVAGNFKPREIALINRLKNWNRFNVDNSRFLQDLKEDILRDIIFVFTPAGEVIELPTGSTALDFAYHIHSEVGNHCMAAKADGVIIPLDKELHNSQVVEIITNATAHPHLHWLREVRTARARSRIRAWLNKNNHLHIGRNIIVTDQAEPVQAPAASAKKLPSVTLPDDIKNMVREVIDKDRVTLKVGGEKNMMITMAKCCNPAVGDDIVGYVSVGRGIIVHRKDCPNLKNINDITLRMVNVEWATVSSKYVKRYKLSAHPTQDLFAEVEHAIKKYHGHIIDGQIQESAPDKIEGFVTIEIDRKEDLKKALKSIRTIPSIISIGGYDEI